MTAGVEAESDELLLGRSKVRGKEWDLASGKPTWENGGFMEF